MFKTNPKEALNFASQTLPFLMITLTFITIAYLYGHATPQPTAENIFEASKINFSAWL